MRRIVLIATLFVCAGRYAHAQSDTRPNTREGFWVSGGLGAGVAASNNSDLGGLTGSLRLGGTLSRSVLIGGEIDAWRNVGSSVGGETITVGSLVGLWYPIPTGALYLKVGLGGMMHYWDFSGGTRINYSAPSASFGLGYEVRDGPQFSFGPYAKVLVGSTTRLHGGPVDLSGGGKSSPQEYLTTFLQFGVGLTWH